MAINNAEHWILQHPTNAVHITGYTTASDKEWARRYKPVVNLVTRSIVAADGLSYAQFEEAFWPLCDDDRARMNEPYLPPNLRRWRFEMEADCENWFHSEVSNVVLAAWASNPPVLQTSHCKPLGEDNIPENVDVTYSVEIGGQRRALAIGEMKRNLVHAASWQGGDLSRKSSQKRLSQELRGSVTFLPLSPLPSRRRKERSGPEYIRAVLTRSTVTLANTNAPRSSASTALP
jgi:hypothetical protein